MNTDKLLPCPFCGGEVVSTTGAYGAQLFHCGQCGANVSFLGAESKGDKKAIEAWNRRRNSEERG